MKRLFSFAAILLVSVCALFANSGDTLIVTTTFDINEPVFALEGSVNDTDYMAADVAFGTVGADSVTAYFRVAYSGFNWEKSVVVTVSTGVDDLASTTTSTTVAPVDSSPTPEPESKTFDTEGVAGYFAYFTVSYEGLQVLANGNYSANVTVFFTTD